MFVRKKLPSVIAAAVALFAMTVFLVFPARYSQSVREGISLWAVSVLPATFPFLFLTAFLSKQRGFTLAASRLSPVTGKLFRVSGAGGFIAVMSALSGYPVGARMILDFYERKAISERETFRLACLCSTSGPMFLVGTVGCSMYNSAKAGWILLSSHLAAVWTVCFFLRFTAKKRPPLPPPVRSPESGNAMYDSLYQSVVSILCVGGFIALFYAFGQMLSDLGFFAGITAVFGGTPFAPYAEAFLRGLLEMTTGCALLAGEVTPVSLALSCFLVTFGGVCVLCQQTAYLSRANVKTLPFLGIKTVQATISALLCYAFATVFCVSL